MKVKLTAILENNKHPEGLKDVKDLRGLEQKMKDAYQVLFDILVLIANANDERSEKVTVISAEMIEE